MLIRRIGSILRGKATPFQLVAACVLGALLGFAPALFLAPALYLLLIAALLVVNANLGLALLVAAAMKLVSLLVVPLSFQVGRFLLDGPTRGLAHAVVNAPVLAWCGLDHYAAAGGQLVGLVLGLLLGFFVVRGVTSFRRRMSVAAQNPSRVGQVAEKRWARFMLWLLFGGTGGQSWEQKLGKRVGNPVRIWGAALLVLLVLGGWLGQNALAGPLARRGVQSGLQVANGATVDVGDVDLDLRAGLFGVAGLALADPNALDQDLFRAGRLEADVDQADLLRGRMHVSRVVVSDAKSGAPRATPGKRLAPAAEETAPEAEAGPSVPGDLSLEDVLAEVEVWKERLTQARRWLERLSGPPASEEPGSEPYSERKAREVRERGWFLVEAEHLVDEVPKFRLSDLQVDGLETTWLPGRIFDLKGSELSTQPWLVDAPPRLELASRDGAIRFEVDLSPVSRGGGPGALRVRWKGLSVDEVLRQLKLPGPAPLSGGTLDLELDGAWRAGRVGEIDLPLRATIRDTTVSIEGLQPTPLAELVLPIGLAGPIDAPRIHFDGSTFADALAQAGKGELARQVRSRLEGELGKKLEEELGGQKLPGDLQSAKEKAQEEAKGLLDGVLGKKKKPGG